MMDRFTEINKETWPRRELFERYTKSWMEMTFSVSLKLRAEHLVKWQQAQGQELTPALLYIFSKELSRDQAFTMAVKDGVLGYWDKIHPLYPVLREDGNFTIHTTPVDGDYPGFYAAYLRERAENAGKTGAYASELPVNGYILYIMPYFAFDSFSFAPKNLKNYFAPIMSIGKYDVCAHFMC